MRCQPVHSSPDSRSASRLSIFGSRSPNDSATGSIRSQCTRATGYRARAWSSLPATYSSAKFLVWVSSWSVWSRTYAAYWVVAVATRAASSPVGPTDWPVSVTVNADRMPSPIMPGLQAVKYEPAGALSTRSRRMPGPMFSISATMRSPSAAST